MKFVVDNKIPLAENLVITNVTIIRLAADQINAAKLHNADALLVRSITPVNAKLLQHSKIKFVGSPTAGIDHLDIDWLNQQQIAWGHTPGANATAVAEYVACCFRALQSLATIKPITRVGIIGVGHVGSLVSQFFQLQKCDIVEYDPPREYRDADFHSADWQQLTSCDLICLHTPLTTKGKHATYHMLSHDFLAQLKPGSVILNTSRGAVLDSAAIKAHAQHHYCLDVWENEPQIDPTLLQQCLIASPHIAGYNVHAKNLAASRIFNQAFLALSIDHQLDETPHLATVDFNTLPAFDPLAYTLAFKQAMSQQNNFSQCRQEYILR